MKVLKTSSLAPHVIQEDTELRGGDAPGHMARQKQCLILVTFSHYFTQNQLLRGCTWLFYLPQAFPEVSSCHLAHRTELSTSKTCCKTLLNEH